MEVLNSEGENVTAAPAEEAEAAYIAEVEIDVEPDLDAEADLAAKEMEAKGGEEEDE